MENFSNMFTFDAKTRVVFGPDTVQRLGKEAASFGAAKVLLVTDKGIVQAGLLEKARQPLAEAGITVAVFDEVQPNPTTITVSEGAQAARDHQADLIVGLGGGSSMDAAKAIAIMSVNEGPLEDYCEVFDAWPNTPPSVICLPTTAGTGAEVSLAAMINLPGKNVKRALFGASIQPAVAIVDPTLTLGLPSRLTALTGIDALSHAVEAYIAKDANPISDALAEKAIELVAENLRQAYAHPEDLEARTHMLLASTMAVIACSSAGLGIVHSLAQTLGGYYDVPHGLSIAVCFPIGIGYNVPVALEKCGQISSMLGTHTNGMSNDVAAQSVVDALRKLTTDLEVQDDLQSLGVREADLPRLAEICMEDGCTPTNPRPIDTTAFEALYRSALRPQE